MKKEIVQMVHNLMRERWKSSDSSRLIIKALKEESMSTEEIFSFINTFTNKYELEVFGDYAGRVEGLDVALKDALAENIEWKELSSEEIVKIISLSESFWHGHYHDGIMYQSVKTDKLSVESMMKIVSSGKVNSSNNYSLQSIIQTNKLSIEQVESVVKASGNYWPVVIRAIETKLFSIDQMISMWEKSYRDRGVALAIVKTGLSSDANKKTLAGSDAGFLKELMEYK